MTSNDTGARWQPLQSSSDPGIIIPLTPSSRPPFSHYNSSSALPATPRTPYRPQEPPEPSDMAHATTGLRPYLSLWPRLLLTLFSPCLLPIMLTIGHMVQNRSSTASLAASLRQSVLSACAELAKGAASIQTMPRYLAMQTNDEVIRATQASIRAIGAMLMDAVTIIEVVVNFIVDTYRSLLLCTIELAVRGTLEILIAAVQVITDGVTNSLNTIRTLIQDDIGSANGFIQSAVSKVNTLLKAFNTSIDVPQFSIPSLDFLANVTIPTDFEDSLIKLNSTLPTLSELKDKMEQIISVPFEALIREINETRIEIADSFNSSLLPVPSLSALAAENANDLQSELCTGLDTSLIDDTAQALHKLSNVAIGLMFLLLFCIWAVLAIWEWKRWKLMSDTVDTVETEWRRDNAVDAWRVVAIVEHPVLEKYSGGLLQKANASPRTKTNVRWLLSYLAHPTCLALLFISILGFLSIQLQLVALDALKAHAQATANSTVAASTDSLTAKLNAAALQSSQAYADQYNQAIARYQQRIDDELFGSWLNTTTVTLNTTLVEFYDGIEQALNTTFGGTILFNPITTFMYCILGSKIDNIEKGLTWIRDHAHIDLTTLPPNVLLLSNSSMKEIATPIAAAAVGSGASSEPAGEGKEEEGVVGSLIAHFESALKAERVFYGIMLAIWLALFLIGLIVVIWNSGGRDRFTAWRGLPPSGSDDSAPPTMAVRWTPRIKEDHPIYDTYAEKQFRGTTPTQEIPRIVEPTNNPSSQDDQSFFEYPGSARRPLTARQGTFGSTISSLAAPGQAFLKITGRKLSGSKTPDEEHDHTEYLVAPGTTSEKYNDPRCENSFVNKPRPSRSQTPQLFWVDRFYGAVGGVKALFPTRGQRHGLALGRNNSTRTVQSFGASPVPSATIAGRDWPGHDAQRSTHGSQGSVADPDIVGRALDDDTSDGRYPSTAQSAMYASHPVYPRPMSRAPTVGEGMMIPRSNPFDEHERPPTLSLKLDDKHDSVDYLYSDHQDRYDSKNRARADSHASSDTSYCTSEPKVASGIKVNVQATGRGTTALAQILGEMQEKRKRDDPLCSQV
ncbi:hypothetical protein IAU60_005962 [Kwoniella sp. DSM 27419]